ncbi:6-carboxytetrahydropterin synthase [bacterium]|nr:MAG: 6-carboxytetrahydropterin synthase [bacterium]
MLFITKSVEFSASHRLFNPEWDFEKNNAIYDKCNNPNGHGHNYVLEVTVKGIPDPDTGYVIDLKKLKDLLTKHILILVDHKHLNKDVDFLKGVIPTVENIVVLFWDEIKKHITDGELYKLKLYETPNSWVEYYGEPVDIKRFEYGE